MYFLNHTSTSIYINDDQYPKNSVQVRYSINDGTVQIRSVFGGISYAGHYTDFRDTDGIPFESHYELRNYISQNFFFSVEDAPAPITWTLSAVTAAGNTTGNGVLISRTSDYSGRLIFRDLSSRGTGFSAGTMSVIMHPTAAVIWGAASGCAIIKLGAYATENSANMYIRGRFLDPYGIVKNWEINGYFHNDTYFVCSDQQYFENMPIRWMRDATGILYLVIGQNDTYWLQPRLQICEVVARHAEDQSIISASFGSDAGLTLYANVKKAYTGQISAAGSYTPVMSNIVNASNLVVLGNMYMQIGNVVSVDLLVQVTPIDPMSSTEFDVSLPIASDLTGIYDVLGVMTGNGTIASRANANTAENKISIAFTNQSPGVFTMPITLKYKIK